MNPLRLAAGIGALAGLRSISPAATLSWAVHGRKRDRPLIPLPDASGAAALTLPLLALGELVFDKTKLAPDRTKAPSLVWRMVSGAVCAGVAARALRADWKAAAVLGGVTAVASSYAGHYLRKRAVEVSGLPDQAVALIEDAVVVSSGYAINRALAKRN
jgi:uncharacterized membrane protein